jgi:hypothetical protein
VGAKPPNDQELRRAGRTRMPCPHLKTWPALHRLQRTVQVSRFAAGQPRALLPCIVSAAGARLGRCSRASSRHRSPRTARVRRDLSAHLRLGSHRLLLHLVPRTRPRSRVCGRKTPRHERRRGCEPNPHSFCVPPTIANSTHGTDTRRQASPPAEAITCNCPRALRAHRSRKRLALAFAPPYPGVLGLLMAAGSLQAVYPPEVPGSITLLTRARVRARARQPPGSLNIGLQARLRSLQSLIG